MNIVAVLFGYATGRQQKNVGGDAHIAPPISFPHRLSQRPGRREWPGGRGRPPLQFVSGNVIQTAGRIISAPTFTHTFSKRPGRRGRRPLQFVSADDVGSSGRPRAASPTGRFQSCCPNGRADDIRPYKNIFKKVLTNVMLCGIIVLGDWYNNTPTRFQGGASNVEFYQ